MHLPKTAPDMVFYFGCVEQRAGHHVRYADATSSMLGRDVREFKEWLEQFDGLLHDESSDRWCTHYLEAADGTPMTFVARRDRGMDRRGGSWAGFLIPGKLPLWQALKTAERAMPRELSRLVNPMDLVAPADPGAY